MDNVKLRELTGYDERQLFGEFKVLLGMLAARSMREGQTAAAFVDVLKAWRAEINRAIDLMIDEAKERP